eukprot:TRINITY_DN19219_c0_g1_i1.p2 TRINITY_DN19219_c0_g1~~TRINITY_DN19219_c0_g1_i1.p2  ORF type:complete len:120 (-),score=15.91 TRINITY_DN19219_c0_g1_i1:788-1120(-)
MATAPPMSAAATAPLPSDDSVSFETGLHWFFRGSVHLWLRNKLQKLAHEHPNGMKPDDRRAENWRQEVERTTLLLLALQPYMQLTAEEEERQQRGGRHALVGRFAPSTNG